MQATRVLSFSFFVFINIIYPVKSQSYLDNAQQICKDMGQNINDQFTSPSLTEKEIAQEKQNLLFMINFAMRGVSSNKAEKNVRKSERVFEDVFFSVSKGLYIPFISPSGYDNIICTQNTLQLNFTHSSKKDFSVWDQAFVSFNSKVNADKYQNNIILTPEDFIDILNLQFIKRKADDYELKGQKQHYYSYYYQWKLNPSIKIEVITPGNILINNKQYPEYIYSIHITREGDIKNVPPK